MISKRGWTEAYEESVFCCIKKLSKTMSIENPSVLSLHNIKALRCRDDAQLFPSPVLLETYLEIALCWSLAVFIIFTRHDENGSVSKMVVTSWHVIGFVVVLLEDSKYLITDVMASGSFLLLLSNMWKKLPYISMCITGRSLLFKTKKLQEGTYTHIGFFGPSCLFLS